MDEVHIREPHRGDDEGSNADLPVIVRHWVAMLRAMEAVGWHPLVGDDDLLTEFERRVRVQLANPKILLLLAETDAGICGLLEAELIELSGIFQPRRGIHISAVYVEEAMRHQGIARRLIDRAFDWARAQGGTFAQLSVLAANPARHLYESIGFTVFEQEMTLPLR